MDPYSSPSLIPNNSLHNPFPHSLLRTRQKPHTLRPEHDGSKLVLASSKPPPDICAPKPVMMSKALMTLYMSFHYVLRYIHAYVHTCIHTYIHTHTCIRPPGRPSRLKYNGPQTPILIIKAPMLSSARQTQGPRSCVENEVTRFLRQMQSCRP